MPEGTRWRDRIRSAAQGKAYYAASAHNQHRLKSFSTRTQCYGGTAAALLGTTAHAAHGGGNDPTGLGRWTYIRIQGKTRSSRLHDLIVVAAYRPNPPGVGSDTVWAQHRRYLLSKGRKLDPRAAFVSDLQKAIRGWRNEGCEVIVGVDANEDVSLFLPTSFCFKMQSTTTKTTSNDKIKWG